MSAMYKVSRNKTTHFKESSKQNYSRSKFENCGKYEMVSTKIKKQSRYRIP